MAEQQRADAEDRSLHEGDEAMDRFEVWAEGLSAIEDPGERRARLRGMARSAGKAARAYEAASSPWDVALAHAAKGYAHAALAELERGAGREAEAGRAFAACDEALAQVEDADPMRLDAAAAIGGACAEVLLQLSTLDGGKGGASLDGPVAQLAEAMAEALWWEGAYCEQALDLADMAEIVREIVGLEEGAGRVQAAQALHDLAVEAAETLRPTGELAWRADMIALAGEAERALADQGAPCPRCGAANAPGRAYCTTCGAPLPAAPLPRSEAPDRAGASLVVAAGPTAGQQVRLRDGVRIGRAEDNDLTLGLSLVSRHHAEVRRAGAGYTIVDLGSSNGTVVNGARIAGPTPLSHGDVIEVGPLSLRVVLPQAETCPSCGAPFRAGAAFCSQCGTRRE